MFKPLKTFLKDETGAVSTDWVVLTAAVVMLGMNAVSVVDDGTASLTSQIGNSVKVSSGD